MSYGERRITGQPPIKELRKWLKREEPELRKWREEHRQLMRYAIDIVFESKTSIDQIAGSLRTYGFITLANNAEYVKDRLHDFEEKLERELKKIEKPR